MLIEHFLKRFSAELNKNVVEVAAEAMELLAAYPWPGNVRELQSILKQALLQTTGTVLLPDFLPRILRESPGPAPSHHEAQATDSSLDAFAEEQIRRGTRSLHADAMAFMERIVLSRVLRQTEGNQSCAAKILGITRTSLRGKLRQHGIAISPQVVLEDEDLAEGNGTGPLHAR